VASRIVVKGGSGAGKSTFAGRLAAMLRVPYIELDALHHGANWSPATASELKTRLANALDHTRGWVVDGNYDSKLGTTIIDQAELIVWLDLALATKLWRLTRRTARHWLRREELWNGNRETLRGLFWGRESLFGWAVISHFNQRRDWPAGFTDRPFVRLRTTKEVEAWLTSFARVHGDVAGAPFGHVAQAPTGA